MTEDNRQKEIRLKKELAKVRTQNANETRKTTKNRDFSVGGLPPDTTHKPTRESIDVPDVILTQKKRIVNKYNIPFLCYTMFVKAILHNKEDDLHFLLKCLIEEVREDSILKALSLIHI